MCSKPSRRTGRRSVRRTNCLGPTSRCRRTSSSPKWSDEDRTLVADRIDTQFVGSPATVAARLRQLHEATGADELVITTLTHAHVDRVRSYELLAEHWNR
ncbi:hypothetical protein AB0F52_09940 [Amycolatopsis sp. NPDC024027]|uniref:hypothetical protein n=1 Tax=Amycolatopsis sp. NPDC024027 TaxID=3154327 RepID=UPI0033CA0ECF